MVVADRAPERSALVKQEVVRQTIFDDGVLMSMLDLSLAQLAAGVTTVPVEEVKARYAK